MKTSSLLHILTDAVIKLQKDMLFFQNRDHVLEFFTKRKFELRKNIEAAIKSAFDHVNTYTCEYESKKSTFNKSNSYMTYLRKELKSKRQEIFEYKKLLGLLG